MDTELVMKFGGEPPKAARPGRVSMLDPVVEELAGHDGIWCLVWSGLTITTAGGRSRCLRERDGVTATIRKTSDGSYDVWARFGGEQ